MSDSFEKMVEAVNDCERLCDVCIYHAEGCNGGVSGGPTGPIYPPCADGDYWGFVDEEMLRGVYSDIMEEKGNEC